MAQQQSKVSTNDALALFQYQLSRANRFDVKLNFPGWGFEANQDMIEAVEIPTMAMGTAEYQVNSRPLLKIPYSRLPAQTCNITFRLGVYLDATQSFLNYMSYAINPSKGEYFVAYAEDLWGEVTIGVYNNANYQTSKVTLRNALITNIDTLQLSYDDRDSYLKQSVTFTYQDIAI